MLTKDRVGAALAIVAGVVGLVLVFTFHEPEGDADDTARPGTSQVAPGQDDDDGPAAPGQPAQPGLPAPAAPGQDDDDQPPAPGQPAQPAQPAQPGQPAQPPAGDADGDDDG